MRYMNEQNMKKLVQEAKDYFHYLITDNRMDSIEFEFLNGVVECVKENPATGEKFMVAFCPDDVLCIWYYTKEAGSKLQMSRDVDIEELPISYQELFQEIYNGLHIFNEKQKDLIESVWQN